MILRRAITGGLLTRLNLRVSQDGIRHRHLAATLMAASSDMTKAAAMHHDTHALPPQFVQDAYSHYNKVKLSDLNNDCDIVDFSRGLTDQQKNAIRPISTIPAPVLESVVSAFVAPAEKPDPSTFHDLTVYEHQNFPGLQIIPGLLPLKAQMLFVSQILHQHLANPDHKINLHTDYDVEYPVATDPGTSPKPPSLFTYAPTDTHFKSKKPSETPPLSMIQFLSKKLRWLTIGDQYDWPTRSYTRGGPSQFPKDLANLVTGLFPQIKPESGVCLLYGRSNYMPVHRDVSEQCETPLASFSFGCDGIFLVARGEEEIEDPAERAKRTVALRVRSGDCVYLTGESRWAWHAMPRTIAGTCPPALVRWPVGTPKATVQEAKAYEKWEGFMGSKRLNVSCRQVWN